MSEFKKVQHATFSPTRCALCSSHEGPFIDTGWDTPVFGHVWICASNDRRAGCVRQMARLDGMVEDSQFREAVLEAASLDARIDQLETELENATVQVVPLAEVLELLKPEPPPEETTTPTRRRTRST